MFRSVGGLVGVSLFGALFAMLLRIFVEGVPSLAVLTAARAEAAARGVAQVGTLVTAEYEELCQAAGYSAAGVFHWWLREL